MSAARKYIPHYTIADYRRWEGDWELWQGIAVSMSPSPFGPHQRVAKNLIFELESQIREQDCDATVLHEIDWIVSDDTVVRPDVLVACGPSPTEHVNEVPAFVAEILSPSTVDRDRQWKRDLYGEQGVAVYVLLDPALNTVEAYRRDLVGCWQHELIHDSVAIRICDECQLTLQRDSLFR